MSLALPGCVVYQHADRTLIKEPLAFSWKLDRKRSLKLYSQWADEAWADSCEKCGKQVDQQESEFRNGFRDGFVDFVYAGGKGNPPPVPPRRFWNVAYRSDADCRVLADQWCSGYREGAKVAREGGYRDLAVLPSSCLAGCTDECGNENNAFATESLSTDPGGASDSYESLPSRMHLEGESQSPPSDELSQPEALRSQAIPLLPDVEAPQLKALPAPNALPGELLPVAPPLPENDDFSPESDASGRGAIEKLESDSSAGSEASESTEESEESPLRETTPQEEPEPKGTPNNPTLDDLFGATATATPRAIEARQSNHLPLLPQAQSETENSTVEPAAESPLITASEWQPQMLDGPKKTLPDGNSQRDVLAPPTIRIPGAEGPPRSSQNRSAATATAQAKVKKASNSSNARQHVAHPSFPDSSSKHPQVDRNFIR